MHTVSQGRPRFSSTKVNAADNFNADLFWGIPVFDNIGWAMLAVFQVSKKHTHAHARALRANIHHLSRIHHSVAREREYG